MKRKAALIAATGAEKPAAETCALCRRPLGARIEWHHVVPRSEGGRETVPLHPICHRAIHATWSNTELARIGGMAALRMEPALGGFLRWIVRRPPDFHAPTRPRD
ncbi:HNH endonuclease [Sphingomonas sp. TX0543]|uniref:HNH endonuclease n=1 Tax=unclassified Sphingomonas TaxID=196159 RepID=UPI00201633A7|nr:HNH endonuclease [Sphingomonas sp. 3P27F8]